MYRINLTNVIRGIGISIVCFLLSTMGNSHRLLIAAQSASHIFLQDTILGSGVVYKRIHLTIGNQRHDVHILQADISNYECEVRVLKAQRNIHELAKLQDIIQYYDSLEHIKLAGAINANFWRAYTNYPIGPVIIDGEIVEMSSYKEWSSILFNDFGSPFIDNFKITGLIFTQRMRSFSIDLVNRRKNPEGIVLYNRYGGHVIPYINVKSERELLDMAIENQSVEFDQSDSTEVIIDTQTQQEALLEEKRSVSVEFSLNKATLKYLNSPGLNKNMYCSVISIDSNSVQMPNNGCIISFGADFPIEALPKVGDTLLLRFETNVHQKEIFLDGVCGTPRLIRNGEAKHEAQIEGSSGRRFINHQLPRTAIGFNKSKDKLYLVAVRGNNSTQKISGASLTHMAKIMKYLGCYNALNLDGGGSTIMVIDSQNVLNESNPMSSRRISVGIGLISGYGLEQILLKIIE